MIKPFSITAWVCLFLCLPACMKYGPSAEEEFDVSGKGLFIINEGNFMYGNASLSYYVPETGKTENEVFLRANGINLGDVAQSMQLYDGKGYIVVNNSGVIFVIDPVTFKVTGTITGLISPRYIHFISKNKAYVTDLYAEKITVIDPLACGITGNIPVKGHPSTEQMVQYGNKVFVSCWSYDNMILVINSETDQLTDSILVASQPSALQIDCNGKIWCASAGTLYRINASSHEIEKTFPLSGDGLFSRLCLNGARDTLYYVNKSVWRMDVSADRLPVKPFIEYDRELVYGLAVDPVTSQVYTADAVDYVQQGVVYRFSPQAVPIDTLRTGINPGAFCFK